MIRFIESWLVPTIVLIVLKLLGTNNMSWFWCLFGPIAFIVLLLLATLLGMLYIHIVMYDDSDYQNAFRKATELDKK